MTPSAQPAEPAATAELELSRDAILGTDDAVEQIEYADPVEIARAIVERILEAPDAETVLQSSTTEHARDVIGQPLQLRGARFQRSRFADNGQGGPTLYALLDCRDEENHDRLITCGSRNVLAQVYRLQELKALPANVRIVEGSETAQGYRPLWLERAA